MPSLSLLSKPAIRRHMDVGTIIITPFDERNLSNASYDVTLGRHYYRERAPESGYTIYNPWQQSEVVRVWGENHLEAQPFSEWEKKHGSHTSLKEGIASDDLVIWLAPGETILGHTEEFIGGQKTVTTMMKARSSIGRNFITVCRCAGWGDVGYINRWTMEITNNSNLYHIPLIAGRRVAQIAFFEVEEVGHSDEYAAKGKYQSSTDIEELKKSWHPSLVLPRLYKDREIK